MLINERFLGKWYKKQRLLQINGYYYGDVDSLFRLIG